MRVDCSPAEVSLTLVEASPMKNASSGDRPPFILVFRSDPDTLLMDGIYAFRTKAFGPDLIAINSLITPRNREPGYYYQAVFN